MAGLLDGIDEAALRPGLTMDDFERWVGDTLIAVLLVSP